MLIPSALFFVEWLAFAALLAVLVAWPLVDQARSQRWGWFVGTLIVGPIAGFAWLLVARKRSVPPTITAPANPR